MHIWLVEIGETIPITGLIRKLRMANLADALAERGHSVLWWGGAFDHFSKRFFVADETVIDLAPNVRVYALKGPGYRQNVSWSRFRDHKILARRFRHLAPQRPRPDGIIATLPSYDMAYEAVRYARQEGVPVIVDVQDQWPEIFLDHLPRALRPLARLALYSEFRKTAWCLEHADALFSMMNTILSWSLRLARRERTPMDQVFYLGAPPMPSASRPSQRIASILSRLEGQFVVTFIGTFASYHNPSILVECAHRLVGEPVCFVLAGSGELFASVQRAAAGMPNLILPGWLDQADIHELLRHSHVGVCPSTRVAAFCPNKAFTYLSGGLPLLSSFQGDLKSIIEENQVGYYYPPNDVKALARHLRQLLGNRVEYDRLAANARRLFGERFSVEKIYPAYVAHVETVIRESQHQTRTHGHSKDVLISNQRGRSYENSAPSSLHAAVCRRKRI